MDRVTPHEAARLAYLRGKRRNPVSDREQQIREIVAILRRAQNDEADILALPAEPGPVIPSRRDHAMLRAIGIRP